MGDVVPSRAHGEDDPGSDGGLQVGYPHGQVDIPELAKVGGNVTHAADGFDKAFSTQAGTVAPGSTLTGWATGAALATATDAWSRFVASLAAQVRSFGADLTKAANDYQSTDAAVADRVDKAGAGTPARHPESAGVQGQAPR